MEKTELGDYYRFDKSPIWQIHRDYFREVGLKAWTSGDIPYTGVSNFVEAYKKARLVIDNLKNTHQRHSYINILEVGAGYGEFAINFLEAFHEICAHEELNFIPYLKYYISDFSRQTLDELKKSGRLDKFADNVFYEQFDALDRFSWKEEYKSPNSHPVIKEKTFDVIFANYLLDQLPARIFAKTSDDLYFEKYLSIDDPEPYKEKYSKRTFWGGGKWIKKIKKKFEFREIDPGKEMSLEHKLILDTCFRDEKDSSIVYSYGALNALRAFLFLLKPNGLIVCSDFNASTKSGFEDFEPCYYGNSLAQAVNFEFIFKFFCQTYSKENIEHFVDLANGHQMVLVYEDPIKPLHTLVLTRPDFEYPLELGDIYQDVYNQNWILRFLYKFLVEIKLSFYLFILIMLGYMFFWFWMR